MSFAIHHKSGKKVTWSQIEQGIGAVKQKGMTMRDAENAVRDKLGGASAPEMRKVYGDAFANRDRK